ncbi:hypothetical protein RHSIM_Rhsim06G0059000 [Rhododendron simsii]|uniref:PUM-HD domain-containing protein n=1 Tax=Rhododendron simsii TaxID=118357 RepID=A0A834GWP1_RHOSS|nr:hypothetical protein RHSIM_Rhsim06G0059000 [Rhododendron simsii]
MKGVMQDHAAYAVMARQNRDLTLPDNGDGKTEVDIDHTTYPGARAVLVLLDHISSQQQISIFMSALGLGAAALANDSNGHFVIRHCVRNFSGEDNKCHIHEIAIQCSKVATDQNGSRLLQSCLLLYQGEYRVHLFAEIIANVLYLAEDRHCLELGIVEVTENLPRQLGGSYLPLSRKKYSSCVVERCLGKAGEEQASWIIPELLTSPNVRELSVDPFGNFVIHTALKVSQDRSEEIKGEVKDYSLIMKGFVYEGELP